MDIFSVFILSIIEGFTEFLPISSTAHLILASHILEIPQTEFLTTFEIGVQLGAILGVTLLYAKKLLLNPKLIFIACVSFLPTGILGFIAYPFIKSILTNDFIPVLTLFIGGIFLILFEKWHKPDTKKEAENNYDLLSINISKGLAIGLFQSLAMIPGVSRSAASVIGGMMLGLNRKSALEFSFILAIPTMISATGYDLLKSYESIQNDQYGTILLGILISCCVAIVSVKWLLKYVQSHTFTAFGIYRIAIALIYSFFFLK